MVGGYNLPPSHNQLSGGPNAATINTLDSVISKLILAYGERETEENWERIDGLLKEMTTKIIPNLGIIDKIVIQHVQRFRPILISSLLTERTRLSSSAMELTKAIGIGIDRCSTSEQFYEFVIPPLLKLCERASRVFNLRALSTLTSLLEHCTGVRVTILKLLEALGSANKGLKSSAMTCLLTILQTKSLPTGNSCKDEKGLLGIPGISSSNLNGDDMKQLLLSSHHDHQQQLVEHIEIVEKMLILGLSDASLTVRDVGRACFVTFQAKFPINAARIVENMPISVQKTLQSTNISTLTAITINTNGGKGNNVANSLLSGTTTTTSGGKAKVTLNRVLPYQNIVGSKELGAGQLYAQIPATAVNQPKSIGQCSKPVVPVGNAAQNFRVGSAQRVLRETTSSNAATYANPTKTSMLRSAQRVTTNSTIVAGSHNNGGITEVSLGAGRVPMAPTSKLSSPKVVCKTINGMSSIIQQATNNPSLMGTNGTHPMGGGKGRTEIVNLLLQTKDSDWNTRQKAFERLECILAENSSINGNKLYAIKLVDIAIHGLGDAHFRVVQSALTFIKEGILKRLDSQWIPVEGIENLVAKVGGILIGGPQIKPKILEEAKEVFDKGFKSWVGKIEGNLILIQENGEKQVETNVVVDVAIERAQQGSIRWMEILGSLLMRPDIAGVQKMRAIVLERLNGELKVSLDSLLIDGRNNWLLRKPLDGFINRLWSRYASICSVDQDSLIREYAHEGVRYLVRLALTTVNLVDTDGSDNGAKFGSNLEILDTLLGLVRNLKVKEEFRLIINEEEKISYSKPCKQELDQKFGEETIDLGYETISKEHGIRIVDTPNDEKCIVDIKTDDNSVVNDTDGNGDLNMIHDNVTISVFTNDESNEDSQTNDDTVKMAIDNAQELEDDTTVVDLIDEADRAEDRYQIIESIQDHVYIKIDEQVEIKYSDGKSTPIQYFEEKAEAQAYNGENVSVESKKAEKSLMAEIQGLDNELVEQVGGVSEEMGDDVVEELEHDFEYTEEPAAMMIDVGVVTLEFEQAGLSSSDHDGSLCAETLGKEELEANADKQGFSEVAKESLINENSCEFKLMTDDDHKHDDDRTVNMPANNRYSNGFLPTSITMEPDEDRHDDLEMMNIDPLICAEKTLVFACKRIKDGDEMMDKTNSVNNSADDNNNNNGDKRIVEEIPAIGMVE